MLIRGGYSTCFGGAVADPVRRFEPWWLVVAVAVLLLLASFPQWTVDDAFVLFRYAENLAYHGALVWNLGQPPVEGYTGVALPILLAVGLRLGIPVVAASRAIGVLSFLTGGLVLNTLGHRLGLGRAARVGCVVLYFTAPLLYTHAFSGLETSLFSTAILVSLLCAEMSLDAARRRGAAGALLPLTLLLTCLVRPEGVALAIVLLVLVGGVRLQQGASAFRSFVAWVSGVLVVPGTAYFFWRWHYYGQLLPNPYYVKTFGGLFHLRTLAFLAEFLLCYLGLPAVAILVVLLTGPRRMVLAVQRRLTEAQGRIAASLVLASIAFVIVVTVVYLRSNLIMNYSYRFFAPFFGPLLLPAALLFDAGLPAFTQQARARSSRCWVTAALLVAAGLGQVANYVFQWRRETQWASGYRKLLEDEHVQAGLFLREKVPPREWLVVYPDIGAVSYLSKLKSVDFGGLCDAVLSHRVPDSFAVDYFYSFRPGAVMFHSSDPARVEHDRRAAKILGDPRFHDYVLVRRLTTPGRPDYNTLVFLRRDLL